MSASGPPRRVHSRNRVAEDYDALPIATAVAVTVDDDHGRLSGSFSGPSTPQSQSKELHPHGRGASSSGYEQPVQNASFGNHHHLSAIKEGSNRSLRGLNGHGDGHVENPRRASFRSASAQNILDVSVKPWPPALVAAVINSLNRPVNEEGVGRYLTNLGWPNGLKHAVIKACRKIPIRFFVVDDSGSMSTNDGQRTVGSGANARIIKCTRWAELQETLKFHSGLCEAAQSPAEFRLLNGADPIIVGLGDDNGDGLRFATEVFADSPGGKTPLCEHIKAVVHIISQLADELRDSGRRAGVIIASDGEATDGDIAAAMKPLENLPVWVVIRLCTGEERIVDYWNSIDKQLELEMDVLDDMLSDAGEVRAVNGWLTYGEPLHRLREFGSFLKELDLLDEVALNSEQMRLIIATIFNGGFVDQIPHPDVDWPNFLSTVRISNNNELKVFDPQMQGLQPWIKMDKLAQAYSGNSRRPSALCIIQ